MEGNLIQINECKKRHVCGKVYVFNREISRKKYLTLLSTNESKKKKKNFKVKSEISLDYMFKSSDYYYKKHMKIKFYSDNELPLNKTKEIPSMTIVARTVFRECKKNHPQVFLDEYEYKL